MTPAAPIRLAYILTFVPHSQKAVLVPKLPDVDATLSEAEVRALRGKLHALDIAIVQELLTSTVYGQLTDTQLARLVPVLAQRRTRLGERRLQLKELELIPRLTARPVGRGLALELWLQQGSAGSTARADGMTLTGGKLLLGAQAYFLQGNVAYPVRAREPWALVPWTHDALVRIGPERLGIQSRDALVRDLRAGGIDDADLAELIVHRGPPSRFIVQIGELQMVNGEPEVACSLEAHYEQGSVVLGGAKTDAGMGLEAHALEGDEEGAGAAGEAQEAGAVGEPPAGGEADPAAADAAAGGVDAAAHQLRAEGSLDDVAADPAQAQHIDPAAQPIDAAVAAVAAAASADAAGSAEATSSANAADPADAEPTRDLEDDEDDDLPALSFAERDAEAEADAIRAMRLLGFRLERQSQRFVAQGELALRALDDEVPLFDPAWGIERLGASPNFHADLQLRTRAKMQADQGLIDLDIAVRAVVRGGEQEGNETVAALIGMQELLAWLHSGRRYVRLADGSFAAPSPSFRQGLRILHDLGAESSRALISPLCIGLLRAMGDVCALEEVDQAVKSLIDELVKGEYPQQVAVPAGLQVEMRDYQRRGLDWLLLLHRHRLTGILADDMGLGKTLQTLALLLSVRDSEGQKPSLVVAPTSVVTVWRDEVARFAPTLKVKLWYGSPQERAAIDVSDADLVVTSYGVLRRDAERLGEVGFRYVILDEAQSTKNARSLGAHAIRQLKSERRLALSGTPLENRPEELWSIFDFLAPGFLGSLRKFRRTYALPIARGDRDATALLRLKIEPLVLRRLKKEVAKELPDKIETTMRCEMGAAQRALYDHVAGELKENIKEKIAQVGIEQAQLDILAALTRLRQICCDPALLPTPKGTKVPPSAKLQMFEELMREALAGERAVVVFSQFVQMQRRLIEVVRRLGVEPLWLHGGTIHRDKVVANFQDPAGPPVIVVSLKAGGTGLTLTRADTVVHYDPWWNPAVERQATDRAHRLGQTSVVNVYRLVCARSIEERVLKMAENKEALAADLLGSEGGAGSKHIGRDEVLALLG